MNKDKEYVKKKVNFFIDTKNEEIRLSPESKFYISSKKEWGDSMEPIRFSLDGKYSIGSERGEFAVNHFRCIFRKEEFKDMHYPIFFNSSGEYSCYPTRNFVFSEDDGMNLWGWNYGSHQKLKFSTLESFRFCIKKMQTISDNSGSFHELYADYIKFLIKNTNSVFWEIPEFYCPEKCEFEEGCTQTLSWCSEAIREKRYFRPTPEWVDENIHYRQDLCVLERVDSMEFVRRNSIENMVAKLASTERRFEESAQFKEELEGQWKKRKFEGLSQRKPLDNKSEW